MRRTKSGNWNTRVIINGERMSITRPTKRQVTEEVELLKAKARRRRLGLPDPDARLEAITFDALADKFLSQYQHSPRSKRTLVERLKYAREGFGHAHVEDITADTLVEWYSTLIRTKGLNKGLPLGPTSKHNAMRAVKQVLAYGVGRYLYANPANGLRLPGARTRRVKPFASWDEVWAVSDALGPTWGPWLRFLVTTGLRCQEWQALEWRHIDLVAKVLHVEQAMVEGQIEETTKTEDSNRFVQLPAPAIKALTELPRPLAGGLIFTAPEGGPVNLSNFRRRIWRPALTKAGVAIRPVDQTRHSFACLALSAGADIGWVSAQLGHSKIQTTLTHYARWLPAANELNVAKLDAFATDRPHFGHIAGGSSDA